MNYLLIGLITLAAYILGYILVFLFSFLLRKTFKKKTKKEENIQKMIETEDERSKKNNMLLKAFFELKDNISILETIYESIENGVTGNILLYLKKITVSKVIESSRLKHFSRDEFELLDKLYSVMISRTKLEFNYGLYKNGKVNLLELRAKARQYLEEAKEIRNDYMNKCFDS